MLRAQVSIPPDSLVWERVGTVDDAWGLFFDADTLYAAFISRRFQALRPGDDDFSDAFGFNSSGIMDKFFFKNSIIYGLGKKAII